MIPDVDLAAYADGELRDGPRRRRLEAALASDPEVAARLERHRALKAAASAAYAPLLDAPVPPELAARVAKAARAEASRAKPLWTPQWTVVAAAAAALAVGVIVGWSLPALRRPVATDAQGLRADGALARALDGRLSGETGEIRIHFSVPAADGRVCRAFSAEAQGWAGLACRDDHRWRIVAAAQAAVADSAGYRRAATALPVAVLDAADAVRAGDAFDRPAELRARANGWRAGR